MHDTAPMVAWLATMQEGLINLGLNSKQYDVHLLKYCQNILECWLSDRAEVVKAGGVAIGAVLSELGRDVTGSLAQKLVELLSQGLKYNYNRAWQTVLSVLAITIEVCIREVDSFVISSNHRYAIYETILISSNMGAIFCSF